MFCVWTLRNINVALALTSHFLASEEENQNTKLMSWFHFTKIAQWVCVFVILKNCLFFSTIQFLLVNHTNALNFNIYHMSGWDGKWNIKVEENSKLTFIFDYVNTLIEFLSVLPSNYLRFFLVFAFDTSTDIYRIHLFSFISDIPIIFIVISIAFHSNIIFSEKGNNVKFVFICCEYLLIFVDICCFYHW